MPDTPPSVPNFTQWPSFPFEGDLRVKQLDDPVVTEPPRRGEGDRECTACGAPDEAYIWVGERWRVRAMDRPTGLPMVLILESRSHWDLGDLPNLLAAELGVLTVRLERAIRSLDGVSRVHVNRWGDGSAHLHLWFLARPYGQLQLRGTFLPLWDSILPPIPESTWRENLALVAAWLADFGGRQLAEPPRIQWQAPASFGAVETAEYLGTETDTVEAAKEAESVQAALGEGDSDCVAGQQGETDGGGTAQGGDTAGTAESVGGAGTAESVGGAGADAVPAGAAGNAVTSADAEVPADGDGTPEAAAASARAATIPEPQAGGEGTPGRAEGEGVPDRAGSAAAPGGAAAGRTDSGVLEQAGDTPPPRPSASNAVPS